ncbi:MAG: aldolase, partial [Pseudonocardiales bacterium]|nr:aldolase [Pseudonocardiales bacterium]
MLDDTFHDRLDGMLGETDADRRRLYPGASADWQPVHTVYVPGDRFRADTVRTWGSQALAALDEHGPLPGFDQEIGELVRDKLAREPVEDLRIDFEDGYGLRSDDQEDADVRAAARALAAALGAG